MSSQVIANADNLKRFASELKGFLGLLDESMTRLEGQFANLGETWRDQEQQKFAQEFQQTMRVLAQFSRSAAEQRVFILLKAEKLRAYEEETLRGSSGAPLSVAPPIAPIMSMPMIPPTTTETNSTGLKDQAVDRAREQGKESHEGGFTGREGERMV